MSARRSAHCPHAVQHIVDFSITLTLNSSFSEAGRAPPLELGQIVRTPFSTLSARRPAHCPHAVQHIVRTPFSTLSARCSAHCPHAAQHIVRVPCPPTGFGAALSRPPEWSRRPCGPNWMRFSACAARRQQNRSVTARRVPCARMGPGLVPPCRGRGSAPGGQCLQNTVISH